MKKGLVLFASIAHALLLFSGCATTGKSVGAGALTGVGLGAGMGALADPGEGGENRVRNVLVGSAIGGVLGAGAGYVADRIIKDERGESYQQGKKDGQREISDQASVSASNQPRLIPARTEARWVGDQIRGSTFVPGHFEYVIIEGARWDTSK